MTDSEIRDAYETALLGSTNVFLCKYLLDMTVNKFSEELGDDKPGDDYDEARIKNICYGILEAVTNYLVCKCKEFGTYDISIRKTVEETTKDHYSIREQSRVAIWLISKFEGM